MKCNLSNWDRIVRFLFGIFLTTWVMAGGPGWGWFGLYLLASSGWGFCLIYAYLKVATLREPQDRTLGRTEVKK